VSVSAAARALGAGVDHHLLRGFMAHGNVEAAVFEGISLRGAGNVAGLCAPLYRSITKQPDGFLRQCCVRARAFAVEQRGSDRQRVRHMLGAVTSRVEDAASVVITEAIGRTDLSESAYSAQHFSENVVKAGRALDSIARRE